MKFTPRELFAALSAEYKTTRQVEIVREWYATLQELRNGLEDKALAKRERVA